MTTLAYIATPLADTDGWGMHGSGWWAPMMIGMVLFWGAVILGIAWLIRNTTDRRRQPYGESAVEILDRRFAEGAISLDDYDQRRNVLAGRAVPPAGGDVAFSESKRSQP